MKIFVISLKDATNRRQQITKRMKELNLSFDFFDAIDGRNGLPLQYEKMVDRKKARNRLGRDISDGEIACALSHALVYKKIMNNKIKHSIILEDDVILSDDFVMMINQKSLENSGKDFVYLYHLFARAMVWSEGWFLNGYTMKSPAKTPNGAVAYYITLSAAKNLCEKVFPITWVSDWGVDIARYNCGLIVPRIVSHPPIENSYLEGVRTGKKTMFKQYGIYAWISYKIKKTFSYKVSEKVEGK